MDRLVLPHARQRIISAAPTSRRGALFSDGIEDDDTAAPTSPVSRFLAMLYVGIVATGVLVVALQAQPANTTCDWVMDHTPAPACVVPNPGEMNP